MGLEVVLGAGSFALTGVYYGDESDLASVLQPFFDSIPVQPYSSSVQTYDWLGILQQLAGSGVDLNTTLAADTTDTFYAKSLMVPDTSPLTQEAILSFFQYLYDSGEDSDTAWFILVRISSCI